MREDKLIEQAKEAILRGSCDSSSMEFRDVVREARPNVRGEVMECVFGYARGNNSEGEMTEFLPFIYVAETLYMFHKDDPHPDARKAKTIYVNMRGRPPE